MAKTSCKIVAILAGGKGTRLKSVVTDVPKVLANVNQEPFLFILLRQLASLEVNNVVLLTGYMHDQVYNACGDGSKFGLNIFYSKEDTPLGTSGALLNARNYLSECEHFVLMNGDTFLDNNCVKNLLDYPLLPTELGAVGVIKQEYAHRYGTVIFDPTTFIIKGFSEKINSGAAFINAGIYKFSKKILNYIPDNSFVSLEKETLPILIKNNLVLKAAISNGNFTDIGTPESYFSFSKNQEQKLN